MKVKVRSVNNIAAMDDGQTSEIPGGELEVQDLYGQKIRIQADEEQGVFQISSPQGRIVIYPAVSNMVYLKIEK